MKKTFTFLFAVLGLMEVRAQAILNEVYALPGSNRQEFFEFYNNNPTPTSMDSYTIVTYFEEGSQKGFYVMDLPSLSVAPKGYFVGSAATPFNYQGVSGSTASQFSWNDLSFLSANNGYVRKWVLDTSVSSDGNDNYDLAPVPPDFNDFFTKVGGSGATYSVMVFNNGSLLNVFLGGTGGATTMPDYITAMPNLYVDMSGTGSDFEIDFSNYANTRIEYVTQDIGSDNGYIRLRDGYCGTWTKSSAQVTHSPGVTNGSDDLDVDYEVSVASFITGGNAISGSTINYDVVAAPISNFPVTLNLYLDNGTVPGELDGNDTYLESKTENTVNDGAFSTLFFPYNSNVLIQTTTGAGCIDHVYFISNAGVLPVKIVSFEGRSVEHSNLLKWTVTENEFARLFEIEKSTDGRNFTKVSSKPSTVKAGVETYSFTDAGSGTAFYRINIIEKNNHRFYSGIVAVEQKETNNSSINIGGNPVESYLNFRYSSSTQSMATITIYNLMGAKVYSQKVNLSKGINNISIAADGKIYTGTYVLEVHNDTENSRTKFIKR